MLTYYLLLFSRMQASKRMNISLCKPMHFSSTRVCSRKAQEARGHRCL